MMCLSKMSEAMRVKERRGIFNAGNMELARREFL
jgi:hypothetical protein